MTIYCCSICHEVNRASLVRCKVCGTIPAAYTGFKVPMVVRTTELGEEWIEAVAAKGCSRQEDRRGVKVYFRTVPLDYYSS